MKKYAKIVPLFIVLLMMIGCAGSSQFMRKAAPPVAGPSPDKALVYFMRPSGIGFAIHFQIWDSRELIGLAQAKSFFAYECDPGKHLFIGIAENKRGVEADLEAGKSYYVLTQVRMGAWKARMGFIPVTRESEWWEKVEAYKKDLNCIVPDEAALENWLADKREKTEAVINHTISYLNTPEGRKYVVPLNREDGR